MIEVKKLRKEFHVQGKQLVAIRDISFSISKGETLGLVGESGCGKSTTGRCLLRLEEITSGEVIHQNKNICSFNREELFSFRRNAQIIFQDPYSSLNPRMTAADIIAEPLHIHRVMPENGIENYLKELTRMVGLSESALGRFPHEFSGGQRQRIGIARALALKPQFIVCDEPISALDVSIQAQIINLLEKLQEQFHLTYLFIAHDLSVVKHISDRIAVMYLGKVMEVAPGSELYRRPRHPYTGSLISAIPIPDPAIERGRERLILQGDVASPVNPPSGCRFQTRCPKARPNCAEHEPPLESFGAEHKAACFYPLD
jgi:oligopeptide/dipeptide ABC transporter ATP-binding protein